MRRADGKVITLKANDIRIDPATQRELRPTWAKYLSENFDAEKLGVLQVSERAPGVFYAMDGQHRIFACRLRGEGERLLTCQVHSGLDKAQEAKRFVGLNLQKAVSAFDRFHVRLNYDPDAQAIEKAVHAVGLKLGLEDRDGLVAAVDALEQVYTGRLTRSKEKTPWALSAALRTLHGAWGTARDAYQAQLIKGAGGLHLRYGSDIDKDHLARALGSFKGGPVQVLSRAKIRSEFTTGQLWAVVSEVMVETYNKGRRTTALPPWRAS